MILNAIYCFDAQHSGLNRKIKAHAGPIDYKVGPEIIRNHIIKKKKYYYKCVEYIQCIQTLAAYCINVILLMPGFVRPNRGTPFFLINMIYLNRVLIVAEIDLH